MNITPQISRLTNNVSRSYSAVSSMGGTVPAETNSDNLPDAIRTIPQTVTGPGISKSDVILSGSFVLGSDDYVSPAAAKAALAAGKTVILRGDDTTGSATFANFAMATNARLDAIMASAIAPINGAPNYVTLIGNDDGWSLVQGQLGGFVTPAMFGAIGDGIADDTAALQEAINNAYILDCEGKTYRVDTRNSDAIVAGEVYKGLNITHGIIIINGTFVMSGVTTEAGPCVFGINTTESVTFEDITIDGGRGAWTLDKPDKPGIDGSNMGIVVPYGAQAGQVYIRNCTIRNCVTDCIMARAGYIEVTGCTITGARRNGVTIDTDCLFENNYVDITGAVKAPRNCFHMEPNNSETHAITSIIVRNNRLSAFNAGHCVAFDAKSMSTIGSIIIENNDNVGAVASSMFIVGTRRTIIENVVIRGNKGRASCSVYTASDSDDKNDYTGTPAVINNCVIENNTDLYENGDHRGPIKNLTLRNMTGVPGSFIVLNSKTDMLVMENISIDAGWQAGMEEHIYGIRITSSVETMPKIFIMRNITIKNAEYGARNVNDPVGNVGDTIYMDGCTFDGIGVSAFHPRYTNAFVSNTVFANIPSAGYGLRRISDRIVAVNCVSNLSSGKTFPDTTVKQISNSIFAGVPVGSTGGNVLLDTTLSIAGQAADAAAVGAVIKAANDTISKLQDTADDALEKANQALKNSSNDSIVTPAMFGAVGDGVTDDTAAIQAAIDNEDGLPVYISGTYLYDQLELHAGSTLLLEDCELVTNFSATATNVGSIFCNGSVGTPVAVSDVKGNRIKITGYAAGDYIAVYDADYMLGVFKVVCTYGSYTYFDRAVPGSTTKIAKVEPVGNITIRGKNAKIRMANVNRELGECIALYLAASPIIEGVDFQSGVGRCVNTRACHNALIKRCSNSNELDTNVEDQKTPKYESFIDIHSVGTRYEDCVITNSRGGIDFAGSLYGSADRCRLYNATLRTHGMGCDNVTFTDCSVTRNDQSYIGATVGNHSYLRGDKNITFDRCVFYGGTAAIYACYGASQIFVNSCQFFGPKYILNGQATESDEANYYADSVYFNDCRIMPTGNPKLVTETGTGTFPHGTVRNVFVDGQLIEETAFDDVNNTMIGGNALSNINLTLTKIQNDLEDKIDNNKILVISQTQYDALPTKDPTVLYLIPEDTV